MSAPKRPASGSLHYRAKLTPEKVRAIRQMHMAYVMGYKTIAERMGVSWSAVRDVVQYKTWRHIK